MGRREKNESIDILSEVTACPEKPFRRFRDLRKNSTLNNRMFILKGNY